MAQGLVVSTTSCQPQPQPPHPSIPSKKRSTTLAPYKPTATSPLHHYVVSAPPTSTASTFGFRVSGFGFRVSGFGFGFRVSGFGFRGGEEAPAEGEGHRQNLRNNRRNGEIGPTDELCCQQRQIIEAPELRVDHLCVCACVHVWVCACVCGCVRAWVRWEEVGSLVRV
jgi:hypothetical protein